MKAVFLCNSEGVLKSVYSDKAVMLIHDLAQIGNTVYNKDDVLSAPELFADTEYIFSTWGMPAFTAEEIKHVFPSLKCVFYGAGTVQGFARPFLECGVKVFSAWAANGVPVAEFTVAQIILANKGYFAAARYASVGDRDGLGTISGKYPGNFGATVGIIGAGMIGRMVIRMLKSYCLGCKVFDPFLSDADAEMLGVRKCSLEEIFSDCDVVSNHLADNDGTKNILTGKLFGLMKPYSTFINTGRGAQIVESEFCDVLAQRPDITALLDVTDPEPPVDDSPFYTLPNCILTPHIAGSKGREIHRMAEYMAEEFRKHIAGEISPYEVTLKMLETMA